MQMGFNHKNDKPNLGGLGASFGQPEARRGRGGRGGSAIRAKTSRRNHRGGRNGVGEPRCSDVVWRGRRFLSGFSSLRNIKTSIQPKSKLGFPPFASHFLLVFLTPFFFKDPNLASRSWRSCEPCPWYKLWSVEVLSCCGGFELNNKKWNNKEAISVGV